MFPSKPHLGWISGGDGFHLDFDAGEIAKARPSKTKKSMHAGSVIVSGPGH